MSRREPIGSVEQCHVVAMPPVVGIEQLISVSVWRRVSAMLIGLQCTSKLIPVDVPTTSCQPFSQRRQIDTDGQLTGDERVVGDGASRPTGL